MDLPRPVTTDELYLAAILEELRALRTALQPAPSQPAPAPEKSRRRRRPLMEPGPGGVVDPGLDPNSG
jgi:hypothetical protein